MEVKFIANIIDTNNLYSVLQINFENETIVLSKSPGKTEEYHIENINIMQFTNKLDIHGKEIYDGHIVNIIESKYALS